jgi:hypothetical protein
MILDLQVLWQNVVKAAFDDEKPKEPTGAGDRRGGPGQLGAPGPARGGNAPTLGAGACVCPSGAVKK